MEEASVDAGRMPTVEAVSPAAKFCHRCGQDLAGRVRYRDAAGYWCAPCSKAEENAYKASHLPCDDCGADVKRGEEGILHDRRLCKVCYQARHTKLLRKQIRAEKALLRKQRSQQRTKRIVRWSVIATEVIVAGALLLWLRPFSCEPDSHYETAPDTQAAPPSGASQQDTPAPARPQTPLSHNIKRAILLKPTHEPSRLRETPSPS